MKKIKFYSKELLHEYIEGRKILANKNKLLSDNNLSEKEEKKLLESMIRGMDFVIKWLETGVYPGEQDRTIITSMHDGSYYWDESFDSYISSFNYVNPFLEIEKKIDRELELKRRARNCGED